jgi:hypothetical protein
MNNFKLPPSYDSLLHYFDTSLRNKWVTNPLQFQTLHFACEKGPFPIHSSHFRNSVTHPLQFSLLPRQKQQQEETSKSFNHSPIHMLNTPYITPHQNSLASEIPYLLPLSWIRITHHFKFLTHHMKLNNNNPFFTQ